MNKKPNEPEERDGKADANTSAPDKNSDDDRDLLLSRKDARSGSPSDASVGGEEDAGGGLEFLVSESTSPKHQSFSSKKEQAQKKSEKERDRKEKNKT